MAKYSKEFKEEAIRLVKEEGLSQHKVAKLIGVNYQTLRNWVQKAEAENKHQQTYTAEQRELMALKKQVKEVKMERDFLKKLSFTSPNTKRRRTI